MWQAIKYVSSLTSLAAFLAAAIAGVVLTQLRKKERLIRLAKEGKRTDLIRQAINDFGIPVDNIHPADIKGIILEQIRARSERFKATIKAVLVLAGLCSLIALFSIYTTAQAKVQNDSTATSKKTGTVPGDSAGQFKPPVRDSSTGGLKPFHPAHRDLPDEHALTGNPVSQKIKDLDGASYIDGPAEDDVRSEKKIIFSGVGTGNIIGFTFSSGFYSLSGKMKLSGNTLEVIGGDVTGHVSLYDQEGRIEGSLVGKSSGVPIGINLQRKP